MVEYWPTAARRSVCAGPRLRGENPPPTRLPRSVQGQGGGRLRSPGTARSNCVSPRRSASSSTTERTAADPSARLFGGYATGQEIDDRRLRLSIAVEPVIGDHSSRKDDADPKDQRERSGNPGYLWRYRISIPLGNAWKNARVKDQYVHAGEQQQKHFGSEENILIGTQRYGVKQQRAGDDHQDEPHDGPRLQAANNLRHRHLAHGPAKEAQVEHHRHAEEQTQRPHVKRFDEGISNLRFVERDAPRCFGQLLEETQQRHSHPVELRSRVRRASGKARGGRLVHRGFDPCPPTLPASGEGRVGAQTILAPTTLLGWPGQARP